MNNEQTAADEQKLRDHLAQLTDEEKKPEIIEIGEHVTVTCYPAVRKPDSDYNALVIIVNYPSDYPVDEDATGRIMWAFGGQEPFNCRLGLVVDGTDTPGLCPTIHFDSISECWYAAKIEDETTNSISPTLGRIRGRSA